MNRDRRFEPLPAELATAPDGPEREVLDRWRREGVFAAVQAARRDAPAFVFWEGPPTANGRPGIHHLVARTVKDVVCRFRTMRGRRVVRKAGWDTQGLPVELEVEKALGISGKQQIEDYGVAAFNAKCRESVWTYKEEWEQLSERIGFWLDYDDPYVTYESDYIDSVWAVLAAFHGAGHVYRGKRVLPYCGRCGTSLSAHEMGQPGVYQDIVDPSVTLRFRRSGPGSQDGVEPESFLAWTTTPWTLPSNFALCVHPTQEYLLARVALPVPKGEPVGSRGHERVWLAAERAHGVLGEGFEALERVPGSALAGLAYEPLFDVEPARIEPGQWEPDEAGRHRIYTAEFVTVDDGTGIVHQAPYGADDWETARTYALPLPAAVRGDGRFAERAGPVAAGTFFKDADDALMDDLKERGLLFRKVRAPHSYPHCWRCRTPLFYYPTPAWFIRTTAYKERMIEANRAIQWVPHEIGAGRFGDWLENNVDWNISRDRYWGTPLPFWICTGCDAERAVGGIDELRALADRDLPADFDPHKPFVDEVAIPCQACGGTMRRTPPVCDVWFDSGSMPYAQYHWPHGEQSRARLADQYPADFIAEGLDQTRGWFYTLHAIGTFLSSLPESRLPPGPAFKTCLVNGLVLDKAGVKMSKSLGNVVSPWEQIERHGVDAVRWYLLASGSPWLPKRYDDAGVTEARRRLFGTLQNSYKFFAEYARIDAFDPADAAVPAPAQRPPIDRWLASRAQSTLGTFVAAFERYDLPGGCAALERFVVDELSNWYIRRNRRRFWKGETGPDKLAAFATLCDALVVVTRCLAPIAPFQAELLWERLGGEGSVHAARLGEPDERLLDPLLEDGMVVVERVVEMGRALRERARLRVRQPLAALHVRSSDPAALELLATDFASAQILDELNIKAWGSRGADDGQLVRLRAKANFRVLGKRVGKAMKAVAAAVAELGAPDIATLRAGGSVDLGPELGVEVGPEDVEITVESKADFDVETDGRLVLWLDTELDAALIAEGLAREVVSRVNGLRKERGCALEERVQLRLWARGAALEHALEAFGELIASETLADELLRVDPPVQGEGGWACFPLDDAELGVAIERPGAS